MAKWSVGELLIVCVNINIYSKNGLLRQFFPNTMSFAKLSQIDVDDAVYRLNHRPRKCLGYRTPHEVFYNLTRQRLN